jgi:hypothetical protein
MSDIIEKVRNAVQQTNDLIDELESHWKAEPDCMPTISRKAFHDQFRDQEYDISDFIRLTYPNGVKITS